MEFLSKDKLAALEEERSQRRKARAEEAQKRLQEVGRQTQQMVADQVSPGGANTDPAAMVGRRVGGLSRVLFEHATDNDGRRGGRRGSRKNLDVMGLQATGRDALRTIDDAMAHINNVAQAATGAGMRGGIEDAARSVNDAVNRVSAAVNIGAGGRQHAAQNNPLADLMQREAEEDAGDRRQQFEQEQGEALQPGKGIGTEIKGRINETLEHAAPSSTRGLHFGLESPELSVLGHDGSKLIQSRGPLELLGHELTHTVQQGRELVGEPGKVLATAQSTAEDLGQRAAAAPRELLQAATNVPREAFERTANIPRDAFERAADAPRQIAENLRDAPAHVVDNVHQIAHHVSHGHASIASSLRDVVDRPTEAVRAAVQNVDPRNAVETASHLVHEATHELDPRNAIESARESVDPRRLATQAAQDLDPRQLVDGAVGAARAAGIQGAEVARNLDPRHIAEQTIGGLDPRQQVRGNADPTRVLENGPQVGPNQAGPNGAPPSAATAQQPGQPNAAQPNAAQPAKADAKADAKHADAKGDAKHADAKHTDAKHADAKHHDAKHADAKHADHGHAAAAHHAPTPAHHAAAPAHGAGVQHPAAPHSGAATPSRNPTGAAPTPRAPAPPPHGRPQNTTPAAQRQASAPHVQPSKDRAPAEIKPSGDTQITPQPVASAAPQIADRKGQLTQPSTQIEARIDNGQVPPATPPPTAAPQTSAPAPAPAAPPVQTTQPTTSNRAVPPLAPPSPSAAPPPNPAIAAGRAAAAGVTIPKGTISPLPASSASAAPGAAPAPAAAAPAGPGAVKTAAAPAPAPQAAPPAQAALPATPTPAAPQTNAPAPAPPSVPEVKHPGGDNVPDPGSLVQHTVSLSSDRSAASSAITSEAQTQSKVAPEASAARQTQISPLGPQMQTTGHSADAPMASSSSSSQAQGQAAAAQGKAQEAAKDAQGKAQVASQMSGAQAERSQFAAMPPPPILQQTSAAAMAPVTQAAQTAVQAAARAVSASAANLDPAVVARGHAAGAASSTLPPFDASRFAAIDQHPALPPPNTASIDAANATAQQTYAQSQQQIQSIANIPAPTVNAPVGAGAGQKTKGGYPTREAAIAEIEQQVTQQSSAQAPGQMKAAAAPVQEQLNTHVSTQQAQAQAQTQAKVGEATAQANEIATRQAPITGAQAAAQAQPQYQAHQAEATAAHTQMQSSITTAQGTAQAGVTAAKAQRSAAVQTAQSGYTQDVQGQVMPQYTAAQQQAQTSFQTQNQTAQTTLSTDQQTAQTQAQTQADAAKAKADADISAHNAQLDQQRQQAVTSHQQQAQQATQTHEAQMTQQQAQMDAQVQSHQSEMHSQVAAQQAQGQQEVNQHLTEGEQGYQQQISQGQSQADAEKARAEQEAAAKKAQADEEKKKHSGGILGGIIGWVKDRIDDLMNAMKAVLQAARDMVVSIMEKARQAAMAVLEKARQAALAVMNKVKGAIQGIISACASAIRSVINACAAAIKGLIQALASALQQLVQALTSMLTALVSAFQAAVNAALDMMIAAVSLVNKDLGDKLRNATQKYRDAFNNAMNGLKDNIERAGQALQHGIQAAADKACAAVDAAAKVLDDAVTQVENTLNAAVDAAYNLGVRAVNAAFDAAEAVVNTAFDIAEAGVKAFFDLQIAQLDVIQKGIDAVADFAAEVADKVMEAVDKIAQAVVSMIPDSWKKAFVDFWNGPWRSVIIIGLATVAAVALTVATGGVAGVLLAGLIGGSIAGGAYFGGEMVARESEISLSTEGKGMYIPGHGYAQIGPDGKPIPPAGMSPEELQEFQKQSGWASSNFNMQRDANGNVTGYDRKSGTDIANYALEEGAKGFVEGAISGSLAVAGGGLGGLASKGLGFAETSIAGSLVSAGVSNVVTGPIQNSLTTGFDAAFDAIKEGKSPMEAFKTGLSTAGNALKDPTQWATAALTMGIAPAKLKFLEPLLGAGAKQTENKIAQTLIKKGGEAAFDTVTNTLTAAGGAFAGKYAEAIAAGKSQSEALAEGRKAADDAFKPENIATNAFLSTAGAIGNKGHGEHPEGAHPSGEHPPGEPHPNQEAHPTTSEAPPTEHGPSHEDPHTTTPSTERTSSDPHTPLTEPNEANARTSSDPEPGTKTDPNHTTEHVTSEPRGEEHPHQTSEAAPRQTESSPVAENPPRETGATAVDERLKPKEHNTEPVQEKAPTTEAPQHSLHEPPATQISEHEPRLRALDRENPDAAAPHVIEMVREARAEIASLKRQRTMVENERGKWAHATPEERQAQVKRLEDQINRTANEAIGKYDRTVMKPKSDAETIHDIQQRTPEEITARQKEVADARQQIKERDAKLAADIEQKTMTDANGVQHVEQVFDHVTLGSGFAGVANEMSRPNVKEGDIVIGGANPWDGATSKFGQGAGQSELPNARPEHKMTETVTDPTLRYMLASEHADNVALNKNDAAIKTYSGQSGPLESGPKGDWPQFAKDNGANVRMEVTGPDGSKRYVYAKETDVASGPGPNRNLSEDILHPDVLKEMRDAGAFAYGDQGFREDSVRGGDIGVFGPGAAGAWGTEATANRRGGPHDERVNDVEWFGNAPDPARQGELETKLKTINDRIAEATRNHDDAKLKEAIHDLTEFTFKEAKNNGFLDRNKESGAAFDPEMQKGHGLDGVEDGNISRKVFQKVEKITFEEQNPGEGKKVKIVGIGPDGKEVVMWKDSLVLSIGQDPGGGPKPVGGPADLVANYKGKMVPIYGEPDATGWRPIVGVQSEDGKVRVLGAAATSPQISATLKGPTEGGIAPKAHQDNLAEQAGQLHSDSKGVIPGFVLSQATIEAANRAKARESSNVRLAETLSLTADQQRAEHTGGGAPKRTSENAPMEAKPVSEMTPEERQAARDKYPDQISALERDGRIPMPNGKASVDLMASITAATGREVALVRLPNKERVMILGGDHHVDLPEGTKIIAHTHPGGDLQFSHEDELALSAAGQKSSVLIGADGTVGRFRTEDAMNERKYNETPKAEQLTDPPLSTVRREQVRGDVANERLAHDFAYKEPSALTPEDHKFLESKGLKVGGVVHGEGGLDFMTFLPIPGSDAKPVIAFRGTSEKADLIDDIHPAGVGSYQMAANEGVIARTMADLSKYGPVTVVGHSLGGALAQMTASRFPGRTGEVVSFQSPGIPREMTSRVDDYNAQQGAAGEPGVASRHYHVQGDFVPLAGESFTPGSTTRFDRGPDVIKDNDAADWKYKLIDDHTSYPTREFVNDGEGLGKWPTGMDRLNGRGPSSAADEQTNSRTPAGRRLNHIADALRGSAGRLESMFERFSNHGHAPREEYVKTWNVVRDQIDRGAPVDSIVATIQSSHIHAPDKPKMIENLRQIEAAASVPDPQRPKPRGSNLDGPVQRKQSGDGAQTGGRSPGEIARAGTAGSGSALPHHAAIQRAFGRHDVGGVRAHVGGAAAESSAALGASAFAHGDAIGFASAPDLHTAAHEAAHVIQQRAGVSVAGGIDGGASDQHEKHADAVADKVVAGESAETLLDQLTKHAASAEAGVQRKMAGTDAIAREMTSKDKAAEMLRHTPPENRGTVESIIRSKFSKEEADEIITKNPSGGSTPKPQKPNGKPAQPGAAKDAKGKKGGGKKTPQKGALPGGKTGAVAGKVAAKHEEGVNDIGAFKGVSTSDLGLIHQELIEHEQWKAAKAEQHEAAEEVGGARSAERAGFIADSTGKGMGMAAAKGVGLGVAGGLLTKGVEKGAGLALAKAGLELGGEEIPGIGPIIAGAFSAYSLWTKNWKEAGETIAAMGTGADRYEKLANTLAGIAEIIDIVVNVLNVIAGVTAAIGLVMWIVTIVTLGAAAPLAITLTEVAAGVVAATLILDAIAKLVINPMILLFRAMHTFQSEADPRDVKEQGEKLGETANQTVGFVANFAGSKGVDIAGEHMGGGHGSEHGGSGSEGGHEQPHTPAAKTEAPHGGGEQPHTPAAKTEAPHGEQPHGEQPHGEQPHGEQPHGEQPHGEQPKAAKPGEEPNGEHENGEQPGGKTRQEKLKEANEKVEQAKAARERVGEKYKEEYEANKAARKAAKTERDNAKAEAERVHQEKYEEIEARRQAKNDEIEATRKAALDKAAAETHTNEERLANAEHARDAQRTAAAQSKEAAVGGAKETLDAKTRAADERLSHAESEARSEAEHGAQKELAHRDSEVEAKHAETVKKLSEIEDPEIRGQKLAEEQQRYAADKAAVAQERAARADELSKPSTDRAKAQRDAEVNKAQAEYNRTAEQANAAEAKSNAATDREFNRAKAAHDDKANQIGKASHKANQKADYDGARNDEGAMKEMNTAEDAHTEADRTADERLADENKELDAKGREAMKERREGLEHGEKAIEEAKDERDQQLWAPWRIVKNWAVKPFLNSPFWEPFSPKVKFEKAHKDIDLLPPAETAERNHKAHEEEEKKTEEERRAEALTPKDPLVEGEREAKEHEEHEKKEQADKAKVSAGGWAIAGGAVGLFAGGVVAAPWSVPAFADKGRAFGEGLASKPEEKKRPIEPNYADPPFGEPDLERAKAQIEQDLQTRQQWAQKKSQELAMQGKEQQNSEKLAEALKMSKEAKEAGDQHKEAIARKDAAIDAQKQRAQQANQQAAGGASRMAGMTIIEIPLKAFQGFTWVGAKLGSSDFQKMNNDANEFAAKLAEMKHIMTGNQQAATGEGAAIDKDKQTNAQTKTKGTDTSAKLVKTETGFQQGKTRVDGAVARHGAGAAQAEGQTQKADQQAKTAQASYSEMSGKLTAWAKQHQQARLEAKRQELARNAGREGGRTEDPAHAPHPVAGEPRGVQPAPTRE